MGTSNSLSGIRSLAKRLNDKTDLVNGYSDCQEIIQLALDCILEEIHEGRRVNIRGFGIFDSKLQGPRTVKPGFGDPVEVPAFWRPTFKYAKPFKEKMRAKKATWD